MPLRGTRVIHPRFQAHHQAVVAGQMTAECTITRTASTGTVPAFDETAGRSVHPASVTVYSGPCRVQMQSDTSGNTEVGHRMVSSATCRVTIPYNADLMEVGDLVQVTAAADDPDLAGLTLTVTGVHRSSIRWQQDLVCEMQPPPTVR